MTQAGSAFSRRIWTNIEAHSEKEFWIEYERRFTYADLAARISSLCGTFDEYGLRPGAVVLLSLNDPWDAFTVWMAAVLDGLVPANLAADITPDRLSGIARMASPSLALISDKSQRNCLSDLPGLVIGDAERSPAASGRKPRLVSPSDGTAYLLFTSGTTSEPKGAVLTHENLEAQLDTVMRVWEVDDASRVFNGLVLHHVDGLVQGPVLAAWANACLLRPQPFLVSRLESDLCWLRDQAATHMISVPTIYDMIDRLTLRDDYFAHASFRSMLSTSASLRPDLWERIEARFGKPVINEYGMTETVAATHFAGPHREMGAQFTIGKPIDCDAELRDAAGQVISGEEPGELWVRGPNIFAGYLKRPDLTEAVVVDGWFRTGDLCTRSPSGDYSIVGRCNTAINSGGFLIRPEEIDEVLLSMPGVRDAQTVGVEDAHFGAIPVSAIVADDPISTDAVIAFCLEKLEHRKVPRFVCQLDAIPRVASGKPDLRALKETLQKATQNRAEGSARSKAVLDVAARVFHADRNDLTPASGPDDVAGWDSYAHLVLVLEVQETFGVELSTQQIVQIETLGDLARLVSSDAPQKASRGADSPQKSLPDALEPLYEAPDTPTALLIALPDIYGNAQYIQHLLAYMSDKLSVFCLKPPHAEVAKKGLTAVGEHYAAILREARFQQPVVLLGHSFAGLLAYETARALHGTTAEIHQTILLDTGVPPSQRRVNPLKRAYASAAHLFRGSAPSQNKADRFLNLAGIINVDLAQHPPARHDLIRAFVAGIAVHEVAPFAGPLALIRATERRGWKSGECLGWEDYVATPIQVHWIEANHIALILDPAVAPTTGAKVSAISLQALE
ncbi:MAG: AMP-binding protein [Dinoroseobacter sp.]|nr:AMP-binding protein [Dinoroseobacter sp.]